MEYINLILKLKDSFIFGSIDDFKNHYNDESICINHLEQMRWEGKPKCTKCESESIYRYKNGKVLKCRSCKNEFTVKVGTLFYDSNLPFQKWFLAIYLIDNYNISGRMLSAWLECNKTTGVSLNNKIRKIIYPEASGSPYYLKNRG